MAIDSKHPMYAEFLSDWTTMEDTYRGERVVKSKTTTYLPSTRGQEMDGLAVNAPGWKDYQAYLKRAVFHDLVSDAIEAMIGMMHSRPPTIELTPGLEDLRERATINGESLEQLLRRINENQLVNGRLGLLLDLPAEETQGNVLPYIATYGARTMINWDNGKVETPTFNNLQLVVLDESQYERNENFEWNLKNKWRVLQLAEGKYLTGLFEEKTAFSAALMKEPSLRGRKLERVPFVFINSKDNVPEPDDPPLLGLARLSLAIYRGEADYRQTLFQQAQDTLVIIGGTSDDIYRTGAGATIHVPASSDAKFIGVGHEGLSEQRSALENDLVAARSKAGQLMDNRSSDKESGDALGIRVAAETASLKQIALSGAFGLQSILRMAAEWLGEDPEAVTVKPNLEFANTIMLGKELADLQTAKTMGAPISMRTIHDNMVRRGLTKMVYEDELEEISQEEPLVEPVGTGTDAGGNPQDDPNANSGGRQPSGGGGSGRGGA